MAHALQERFGVNRRVSLVRSRETHDRLLTCAAYWFACARSRWQVAFGGATRLAKGALREAWCGARTQPFVPVYYLVSSMGGRRDGTPVILVHGYGQNCAAFRGLAAALSAHGLGPIHAFNYPWFADIRANAKRLWRRIERVAAANGAEQVDLVAHSLGGIVVMEYLRSYAVARRVRRCVTIASPHGGVNLRNPLPGAASAQLRWGCDYLRELASVRLTVPTLSIASSADLIAYPASACSLASRGGRHVTVRHAWHLSLLFSERIWSLVAEFLRNDEAAGGDLPSASIGRPIIRMAQALDDYLITAQSASLVSLAQASAVDPG